MPNTPFILLLLLYCLAALLARADAAYMVYNTTHGIVPGKINVHLVAHTHDDVGWLKTVDQYYVGDNNSIQGASVENVLDSVVSALSLDKNRKFIYAEQAFFQRWWRQQSSRVQSIVKKLVNSGQLEFINGGMCMHDEAATHYIDMIDQTTLGHRFIKQEFGKTPRIGWQIDPFGHSAVQAYLLGAEVGFDSLFYGRIDYQDREKRKDDKNLEVVWQGSNTLGSSSQIFAGAFPDGYGPPDGFSFEVNDESPFVVILFQAFLPGSVVEKSSDSMTGLRGLEVSGDLGHLKEMGLLDFGEGIRFVPSKLLEKFRREAIEANRSATSSRPGIRAALRKPQLALVLADLSVDAVQLQMTSIAMSLQEIGYSIQVYSLDEGPVHAVWRKIGFSVTVLQISDKSAVAIDWLNYDGVLVNSLDARDVISCLLQEPFKSLPVIWTIHEKMLALRLRKYTSNGQVQLMNDWKRIFNRATVIVFPNYVLPMMYSTFDAGNYFVIPGSPAETLETYNFLALHRGHDARIGMAYASNDFVVAITGSQFSYTGSWLEHTIVLKALAPLIADFCPDGSSTCHLKVGIVSGNSSSSYKVALEAIALKLGYPSGSVQHIGIDGDVNSFLSIADLVIYGSFLEEQSFPAILLQAMCFGKPVIAPDLSMIKKYIDDRVNGYLFPKEDISMLTQVLFQVISKGQLSLLAQNIASIGKRHAKNLMVSETIEGYALLLGNVLKLPSEVANPKAIADIPLPLKEEWQWHLFEEILDFKYPYRIFKNFSILDKVEKLWNPAPMEGSPNVSSTVDQAFFTTNWEELKSTEIENARKRREEEELKDRTDQPHGTWEEVYRSAKRANRNRNELHERDDRELERTGQPLCIYEPYFGEGTWPFLHQTTLYRGIGLSTKGRRPGFDDIDAPSRLPILNDPYYRDVLGEYGAFFALANRIDRIHKNAWIGFQSWRAVARKDSLSRTAESMLLEAIQARRHGDALYFWVRMDKDPRNPLNQDFWSFCDAVNAGNCRFAVSEALRKMYGIRHNWDSLPPMPVDGDTWSVMYSWVLPTRSFLEFVMFSRMFVDALDGELYDGHHQSGRCYLSLSKDRHCYSRLLELLVNVWAYHSARRMVYVNPETGAMQEHHKLKSRRGHMWVRWFSFTTLKSMDEDLAEEWDSDRPDRRSLWPLTGEVFWQGVYERERNLRHRQKEKRKQQSKDKISRIRKRTHQKTLGKYVKPPPEMGSSNLTLTTQ